MLRILALSSIAMLAGCAAFSDPAQGPLYTEVSPLPVQQESASITILRTGEDTAFSGNPAWLRLDGKDIGKVKFQGFQSFNVAPGDRELEVSFMDRRCPIPVQLDAGKTSYFKVSVRSSAAVASIVGGFLGGALESAGKQCAGPYMIQPIDEKAAQAQLQGLRQSY